MLIEHLNQQRLEREAQGLLRQRRVAHGPCAPRLEVTDEVANAQGTTRPLLAFCSNDYLGLANHPTLTQALAEGARRWGAGSGASHLVSGHTRAHAELEEALAAWMAPHIPQVQALSFSTGFMANLALLTTLGNTQATMQATMQATLFADKLNHASLIDGALLAKAKLQRYAHRQFDVLERQLAACTTPIKLIVTDAVFSMDGDIAELDTLLALAERFDAWLIVDDAHGFGVLGERGRGALAHFNLRSERLIYMGTLGKAAGVAGAFVAAHASIIDALIQSGRSYIYTTAAPAALAHALRVSLDLIQSDDGQWRRAHLGKLIASLRQQLNALLARYPQLGWTLMESNTAIQPLVVGSNEAATALARTLDEQGLWVPAIRPPTVPAGSARLRISLSAAHSHGDVKQLMDALTHAAQTLS